MPANPPPKALEALRGPILQILRQSDLASISAKKVRLALQNTPADAMQGSVGSDVAGPRLLPRLGIDLEEKAHKKAIDGLIRDCFDTINNESTNTRPGVPSQSNGSSGVTTTNPPKLALPGMGGVPGSHSQQQQARSASTSKPSATVTTSKKRSHAANEDVDSDEEDVDRETIKKTAAKQAKAAKQPAAAAKKKKKAKTTDDDGEPKEKKAPNPNNPFNRPVILSDEMSQVCGGKEMPRYMITKQLWSYIKERDLQDPSNKRKINCDPTLQKLFGKSQVDSFEMAKLISPHVTKKEVPAVGTDAS